jgi:protocatechuate 3,4-dioxygenase beta subunit
MQADIEHNDDIPVGRVLSRREMLGLLAGLGGAALLAACDPLSSSSAQPTSTTAQAPSGAPSGTPLNSEAATAVAATPAATTPTADTAALPSCVVRPEQTEGPYFVDEKLNRSNIRSNPSNGAVKEGTPLRLKFNVSQVNASACVPLVGAFVDVWHCDAEGVYSDVTDRAVGFDTTGQQFLRGYQVTDANGSAEFTTIYPGWYQGRTVHIHFKIRTSLDSAGKEFTSQLFFDDALSDEVFAQAPYAAKGQRSTKNGNDGIYRNGGDQLMLSPTKEADGYAATFDIGLQMA